MAFYLKVTEKEAQERKYVDNSGNAECVSFVQQACGAPSSTKWVQGLQVKGSAAGAIKRGTAIATFDSKKKYPTDGLGKHAAVYLSHDKDAIQVLDQWASQGKVKPRAIRFGRTGAKRSDDGDTFYVIE